MPTIFSFSPKPLFCPILVCQDLMHPSRLTLNSISSKKLFLIHCCLSTTSNIRSLFYSLIWQFSDTAIYYKDLWTWVSPALPHNKFLKNQNQFCSNFAQHLMHSNAHIHAFIQLAFGEHHLYSKSNARGWHATINKVSIGHALMKFVILWGT